MWHFLRTFSLPYCSLYEQGYTSLGKKSLTLPNPALRRKYIDNSGALVVHEGDSYWPAYMVRDAFFLCLVRTWVQNFHCSVVIILFRSCPTGGWKGLAV